MTDEFSIDLTGHELTRRAMIAEAGLIDDLAVAAGEAKAWKMLYSDLDPGQQSIYDMLIDTGILPRE